MANTCIGMAGFESNTNLNAECVSISRISAAVANPTYSSAQAKQGTYSALTQCTGVSGAWLLHGKYSQNTDNGNWLALANAQVWASVWLRFDALPTGASMSLANLQTTGSVRKLEVALRTDGKLDVYDASGTVQFTGATVLAPNTWYRLDLTVATAATNAAYTVRINETVELTGTLPTGSALNTGRFIVGQDRSLGTVSNTVSLFQDQVWVDSTDWAPSGYLIVSLRPAALKATTNGGFSSIVGGDPTQWEAIRHIGNSTGGTFHTDDPNSAAAPVVSEFGIETFAAAGLAAPASVAAIAWRVVVNDNQASVPNTFLVGITAPGGGTMASTGNTTTATTFDTRVIGAPLNPTGAVAWTQAAVEGGNYVVRESTTLVKTAVYFGSVIVAYVPAVTRDITDNFGLTDSGRTSTTQENRTISDALGMTDVATPVIPPITRQINDPLGLGDNIPRAWAVTITDHIGFTATGTFQVGAPDRLGLIDEIVQQLDRNVEITDGFGLSDNKQQLFNGNTFLDVNDAFGLTDSIEVVVATFPVAADVTAATSWSAEVDC